MSDDGASTRGRGRMTWRGNYPGRSANRYHNYRTSYAGRGGSRWTDTSWGRGTPGGGWGDASRRDDHPQQLRETSTLDQDDGFREMLKTMIKDAINEKFKELKTEPSGSNLPTPQSEGIEMSITDEVCEKESLDQLPEAQVTTVNEGGYKPEQIENKTCSMVESPREKELVDEASTQLARQQIDCLGSTGCVDTPAILGETSQSNLAKGSFPHEALKVSTITSDIETMDKKTAHVDDCTRDVSYTTKEQIGDAPEAKTTIECKNNSRLDVPGTHVMNPAGGGWAPNAWFSGKAATVPPTVRPTVGGWGVPPAKTHFPPPGFTGQWTSNQANHYKEKEKSFKVMWSPDANSGKGGEICASSESKIFGFGVKRTLDDLISEDIQNRENRERAMRSNEKSPNFEGIRTTCDLMKHDLTKLRHQVCVCYALIEAVSSLSNTLSDVERKHAVIADEEAFKENPEYTKLREMWMERARKIIGMVSTRDMPNMELIDTLRWDKLL